MEVTVPEQIILHQKVSVVAQIALTSMSLSSNSTWDNMDKYDISKTSIDAISSGICPNDVFFKTGLKWTLHILALSGKNLESTIFAFILLFNPWSLMILREKSWKFCSPHLYSHPWSSLHCEYNPELGFVVSEAETSRAKLRRPLAIVHIVLLNAQN